MLLRKGMWYFFPCLSMGMFFSVYMIIAELIFFSYEKVIFLLNSWNWCMIHVSLNYKLQENKEPSGDLVGGRLMFLVKCTINTGKTIECFRYKSRQSVQGILSGFVLRLCLRFFCVVGFVWFGVLLCLAGGGCLFLSVAFLTYLFFL